MATRLPLVGESKEDCRKRIMESCQAEWSANTPETTVLREVWRQKARTLNKERKTTSNSNLVVLDKPVHSLSAVVPIEFVEQEEPKRFSQLTLASSLDDTDADASTGFGVLGMGDVDHALSKETLDAAYGTGFVKQFSGEWRQRTGSTIGEPCAFPEHTVRVGCLEGYNFLPQDHQEHANLQPNQRSDTSICCKSQAKTFGREEKHGPEGWDTPQPFDPEGCESELGREFLL